jgi:hypothetical protein
VCAKDLGVEIKFLTAMASEHADRRALAERVRETIAAELPPA